LGGRAAHLARGLGAPRDPGRDGAHAPHARKKEAAHLPRAGGPAVNQDPLDKLARALAGEHDGAHIAPGATRARIMQQLQSERRKKRLRLLCFAPLLGAGIGSTAFAAAGTDLPAALAWVPALFAPGEFSEDVPKKALPTSRSDRPAAEVAAPASSSIPAADAAAAVPASTAP